MHKYFQLDVEELAHYMEVSYRSIFYGSLYMHNYIGHIATSYQLILYDYKCTMRSVLFMELIDTTAITAGYYYPKHIL